MKLSPQHNKVVDWLSGDLFFLDLTSSSAYQMVSSLQNLGWDSTTSLQYILLPSKEEEQLGTIENKLWHLTAALESWCRLKIFF